MRIILLAAAALLIGCAPSAKKVSHAMVVSARVEASQIGADIMSRGGNAFDAMIATEFALAVAYPYAGNLAGGGFMVFRLADGKTGSLDYREKAPAAASRDMFLDPSGNVILGLSTDSALSVGVPGTVAGMFEVHRKFGSMPMSELLIPVIKLARRGVVVTEKQKAQIDTYRSALLAANGPNSIYQKTVSVGDTIKYEAIANTLERISGNGVSEFYSGETAAKIVSYLKAKGGVLTLQDLQAYKPIWRDPVTFNYKELKIISMPPPSSGGICLAQILKMIEPYDIKSLGHNSQKYIQLLTEAERRAYADRNEHLGDPDFHNLPISEMLSDKYLKDRMRDFSFDRATPSQNVGAGVFAESDETTHYSIVDSFGNAVSATTTLNGAFGSKLYIEELGIFLNNQMDDFSAKTGSPNMYGLTGSSRNAIAPNKRMLSSMTPTIAEKDGKLYLVVGSPGGSSIITSVMQVILNVYEFGMPVEKAVSQKRFHHQWLPDEINLETGFDQTIKLGLNAKGYDTTEKVLPVIGKVNSILIENSTPRAGADPRGDDAQAGF